MSERVNLLNYNRRDLEDFFLAHGEKPFRATQILKWMHQVGVPDFAAMTDLSKPLRAKLAEIAEITPPEIVSEQLSQDGTRKWVVRLLDGNCIETVFIPEDDRGTLCVSSQVGCALNCSFCSTGRQGFNRNLTTAEIIGQVWLAVRRLGETAGRHDHTVSNIVMMGMGEPLLNFDPVVKAMELMMEDFAYGLSRRRVTLSTSGVVPAMQKLSQASPVSLAVSLHAPNNGLRDILVPINKKYPLEQLMPVCQTYFQNEPRRKIMFEYVMLDGVNDRREHAEELIEILRGVPAKVNLIPFNSFPGAPYQCSSKSAISRFFNTLLSADVIATTRKTRGPDIDAACGQLVGQVADRTRRQQQYMQQFKSIAITAV